MFIEGRDSSTRGQERRAEGDLSVVDHPVSDEVQTGRQVEDDSTDSIVVGPIDMVDQHQSISDYNVKNDEEEEEGDIRQHSSSEDEQYEYATDEMLVNEEPLPPVEMFTHEDLMALRMEPSSRRRRRFFIRIAAMHLYDKYVLDRGGYTEYEKKLLRDKSSKVMVAARRRTLVRLVEKSLEQFIEDVLEEYILQTRIGYRFENEILIIILVATAQVIQKERDLYMSIQPTIGRHRVKLVAERLSSVKNARSAILVDQVVKDGERLPNLSLDPEIWSLLKSETRVE